MKRDAFISPCKNYRYSLSREWNSGDGPLRSVLWVMLNPSTANALEDDPTIRRCIGFSQAWGFDQMFVGNLFAYRSTDPDVLLNVPDPIGPGNLTSLWYMASQCERVVCAWGSHKATERANMQDVRSALSKPLQCLGLTKTGKPKHPLYLPSYAALQPYGA